ncbi:MAG: HNH nuclease family protein [Candidatus Hydrogenedentes bacterium]|nr:HNH nuclease family protein [Candidatus Hydrogenedentota bacterium]
MAPTKKRIDPKKQAEFLAKIHREQALRQTSYRDRALSLFPHVCARCGREFTGKNLNELTVHHKDSDHMNNPPDGSNWELLCLYCHDNEHQDAPNLAQSGGAARERPKEDALGFRPFEGLANLLDPGGKDSEPD